jgi:pyruvate formate lyase activating enzyme
MMAVALTSEAAARISRDENIPVAGIVPLTTVDFPNRLALVVFTAGCPWRCSYCHNASLRKIGRPAAGRWRHVCDLLEERRGFLEAVVFSGGEPTLHRGLETAVRTVRSKGFLAGLHTAGIFPESLARVLPWLDWIGLDIKAPFDERYARLTGDPASAAKVALSLNLLRSSGVPFELRTTVGPDALSDRDFAELCQALRRSGAPAPVKQAARQNPASNSNSNSHPETMP